ncbi:MAG TPA: protein kinase, partial [Polyangiaceae bacterium]
MLRLPGMTEGEPSPSARPSVRDPFGFAGTLLERKYRVDRMVAEGGFGVVYAGHHLGLDAPIAIKALRPSPSLDGDQWADALHQFMLEAKMLAKLRGPSVVTVYDAGVLLSDEHPAGLPWIVLEWIDGETLQQDLARRRGQRGRRPVECFELMRPVLEAIADAHESGIAHRDLKPSNIMLARGSRGFGVRVLDFGIAKMVEREAAPMTGNTATDARFKAYSPHYAAPEQVSGMRTGPWTDVHALGLMLTEILTDAPPYDGEDPNDLYRSVFDTTRPSPGKRGIEVGPWQAILARALSIKPTDRQATARELLTELEGTVGEAERAHTERLKSESAPTARSFGGSILPEPPRKGRRSSKTMLMGGAVVVAGLAIAGWRSLDHAKSPAAPEKVPLCTTNAACVAASGGKAAVCRPDRGCVALDSVDCVAQADPRALGAEDTVWFGTLFPRTGADAKDFGLPNTQAAELARRDFAEMMGGTAVADAVRAPPFGLLECDDAVDPRRAAAHMVDAGVVGVIGFSSGKEAIDLATSLFIPNGIVSISATSTDPLVTGVPEPPGTPRLVWRTTYTSPDAAAALGALVTHTLEPAVRADYGGIGALGKMRLAVLRPRNTAGVAFSKALADSLVFNGTPAPANGADYRELTYDSLEDEDALGRMGAELGAFAPHIVIYVGAGALVDRALLPLEHPPAGRRRLGARYVSAAHFEPAMLRLAGTAREERNRVFGVAPVSSRPANARFVAHYRETFADAVTPTDAPNTVYDAFYLLAFAAYASDGPPAGASLARAFSRLEPPGVRVEVDVTDIFSGFRALRAGQNIDLSGATGDLDL